MDWSAIAGDAKAAANTKPQTHITDFLIIQNQSVMRNWGPHVFNPVYFLLLFDRPHPQLG